MKKKTRRTKVKKVRLKKVKPDKPVKVKEYGKYKKIKIPTLKPEQMGVVFLSDVIKTDNDGEPILTRRAKFNKGKLVKETYYNITTNEIEHTVGATLTWND